MAEVKTSAGDRVRADDHLFLERTACSLDAPPVPCPARGPRGGVVM